MGIRNQLYVFKWQDNGYNTDLEEMLMSYKKANKIECWQVEPKTDGSGFINVEKTIAFNCFESFQTFVKNTHEILK